MSIRCVPKPLLSVILALLSLSLIAMPVASYAAPIARAASSDDPEETDSSASPRGDIHAPEVEEPTIAADLFARAENPREVRALRQLGVRFQQPCQEGEAAAEDDINGTAWAIGGCLATVLTLGAATFLEPEPPSSALVGKDDQYVAEYTDCYKEAGVDKRQKYALYGCIGGGLAYVGLWVAIIAGSSATSSSF